MTADAPTAGTFRQVRFERPPTSVEILLVRHGESADVDLAAPFPLVDGRGDPPLSDRGREQAVALATRLAAGRVDALYVTQLRRTLQTAAPLAEALGLEPVVEPGMVEVAMGEWEGGLYRKHLTERHPLALEIFARQRWDVIPGAESNESLFERTGAAIEAIAARHPGGRVVVVSHAVAISSVLARAASSAAFAFVGADNTSVSALIVDGERWFVRRFNDTAHLEHLS